MRLPRPHWPQLSDSQVTTLVLAVGVSVCIVIAALRFGLVVGLLTLNAVVAMLILERTKLFRLVNEARADAEADVDHLRDRHDRELAEIRGYLAAADPILRRQAEPDVDDLAWSEPTQPIAMPAPEGPATQPADVVLIGKWAEDMPHPVDSDDRKALHEAWVEEQMAKFQFSGGRR